MNISELRSPFVERVINVLSRGHEEAMKQAFYNVAAICLFIILGGATLAVYFILEPFVKPLLWAILVGSFLYPFKRNSAILMRSWLTQLKDKETLLVFGFLQFPLKAVDSAAEWIGTCIIKHIKPLMFLGLGVLFIYNIQNYLYSPSELFCAFEHSFWILQSFMEHLSFPGMTRTCIVGLLGSALILVSHQTINLFSHLAWIFILGLIISIAGSSLCAFFFFPTLFLGLVALAIRFRWLKDEDPVQIYANNEVDAVAVNLISPNNGLSRLIGSNIFTAALSSLSTPLMMKTPLPTASLNTDITDAADVCRQDNSSNRYIYSALWFCIVVQLWRHSRLLELIPIPLAFFLMKSIGSYFNLWKFSRSQITKVGDVLTNLFDRKKDLLFPQPIQWLYKAVVYLDRILVRHLINKLDAVVTIVVICVVVVSTVLISVFVAFQIYGESLHLLQLGSSLVNQTLNHPEAKQWLPQGIDQMINISAVVDNAYAYGKSGITTLVKNTINEKDPTRAAQIERALLEALDRVQTAWMSQDHSQSANKSTLSGSSISDSTFLKPPLHRRLSTQDLFNVTLIVNYGRENIGSILSILDSIWTLLKGNVSLVFKSATVVLSVLIGGGTTIMNFLVSGVVFLTALYYLLAASDSQYKPIQLVSLISPGAGNSLGTAMEEAIKTVCIASLKFSAFYGLWTWLIHTVFRANFVVIPAALAALLGAVPFLGTYWAAIPAALDLWLVQDRGLGAVVLMAIQFAPTLWVDAAFYAEVKGGGHPYLTGLAVAGGIFWLGIEGAIIGPLLLCVLLVVVSIYSNLFQNDNLTPVVDSSSRLLHRRLLRTDTVG